QTRYLKAERQPARRRHRDDGPLLIIAGPGSGKTRVITHRIAYLVRVVGISPYRIAAVTFTNKAAREMRQRLVPLLGQAAEQLTTTTFHAFCANVLRREGEHIGLDRDFVIYDDADQMALVKRALIELELDPKRFPPRSILSGISSAKSELLGVEGLAHRSASYWDEIVVRAYERYEDLLRQCSAVDFDDLLLKTYQLFDRVPDVAQKYQERYVHFMVDEFQDTNVAQYAISRQMARHHLNICVVGDPDQSIYTWRNADIRNILSFQDDYPKAKLIALEENYRSTQTILDAARSLIASNTQRVEKDLWTRNGSGVPIVIAEGYNEEEEAQFVVREIQSLTRNQEAVGDIAVMYRVNAQSRALEEACLRYGVPYQVVGGMKFYQRQEVKDIIAYLRLIANPDDDVSLNRVINLPTRGIGQRTLDHLARTARDAGTSQFAAIQALSGDPFTARARTSLIGFGNLIKGIADERDELDLLDIIDAVLERSGYQRWLSDQPERSEERLENIQEFRASARDYLHFGRAEALTAFLESVSLVADVDSMEDRADAIRSSRCIRRRAWSSPSSSWSAWKKDCSRTRARWTTPRNWRKSAASAMSALPAPKSVCTCCARSGVASVAAPSRAHHRVSSSTSRRNYSPRPRSPSAQAQAVSVRQSGAAVKCRYAPSARHPAQRSRRQPETK
ncbi:ATP-dependent DNA helicase PcrA, partial [Geodia barretti]